MRAGRMRHPIKVQRATTTSTNAYGEPTLGWLNLFSSWAQITPLTGRELFAAQQVNSETTHGVRMRHNPGETVTPKDRITFNDGNTILNIIQIMNVDERDRELELLCKEAV